MATFYTVHAENDIAGVEMTLREAKALGLRSTREGGTFSITTDVIKVGAETVRAILAGEGYVEESRRTEYTVERGKARATSEIVLF